MTNESYERRIDGQRYYGVDFKHYKEEAQEVAEKWRKKGHKARVIKTRERNDVFYVVYIYPSS